MSTNGREAYVEKITGAACGGAATRQHADEEARPRRMTICDGVDGMLTLDLRYEDIHWLVDACRRLAAGSTPPNGGMLKVRANGTVYLVSAVKKTGNRVA